MQLNWCFSHGRFEEPDRAFPNLTDRRLQLIRLIGKAESIETDDKVFRLIHAMCVHACVFEHCKSEEEAEKLYLEIQRQKPAPVPDSTPPNTIVN